MKEIQIGDRFFSRWGFTHECTLTGVLDEYYKFENCFLVRKSELGKYFNTDHLELINGRYYWPSNNWDTQRG